MRPRAIEAPMTSDVSWSLWGAWQVPLCGLWWVLRVMYVAGIGWMGSVGGHVGWVLCWWEENESAGPEERRAAPHCGA